MLWPFVTIAIIGFCAWLAMPKPKWENSENLKENAKIISVHSKREGFGSARTIRTYVTFDDGFVYSSCKVYSSLTTQFVNDEIREIIMKDAVTKHEKLIEKNQKDTIG